MFFIALRMLLGDRAKYISMVLGLSFASFIITQQAAILVGIINRTFGFITDTSQPNIWVVDPTMQYIDDIKPLKDTDLYRVRSVEGVAWAAPFYKGLIQSRLHDGTFQACILLGIDDATLIGAPPLMLQGDVSALRTPGGVIVDEVGARTKLAKQSPEGHLIPLQIGDVMELNDHRAVVVGICRVSRTFQSQPVLYTTYQNATQFVPSQRKLLSMIIAHTQPGVDVIQVCDRIRSVTGYAAYSAKGLKELTVNYYIKYTGIFVNFGVAIFLGFIIGTSIAGQTLYTFTMDNLPYFGVFKAMGASHALLRRMVLLQACFVSTIGWGIGMGATALFGLLTAQTELSFSLPLWLYIASACSILGMCLFSAALCIRRIIQLDPAIVFKNG